MTAAAAPAVLVAPVFPVGDAGSGALADALTAAFATARDAHDGLAPGDCVVFLTDRTAAVGAAVAALTRSLALEWAPDGVRVNAIRCADPGSDSAAALLAWLRTPPALMLTGAVLEAQQR
jgi:NAD(P)-dependent dehydrogenase (short-subunit alcohol dehydrogenase family)